MHVAPLFPLEHLLHSQSQMLTHHLLNLHFHHHHFHHHHFHHYQFQDLHSHHLPFFLHSHYLLPFFHVHHLLGQSPYLFPVYNLLILHQLVLFLSPIHFHLDFFLH